MVSAEPAPDGVETATDPLISVVVLAYNHEQFIEQAVRSVLGQTVLVPIEILIGEDCSTDRTREILMRLDQENPGRLRLLFRPSNLGLAANLQDCRQQAHGRYLAILEGDDFWTDHQKLQKQFDAMEANPGWSMCFHACEVRHSGVHGLDFTAPLNPPLRPLGVSEMLVENRVQTMSVTMYRQGIVSVTPDWHARLRNGDWALYVLHADRGPIGFVPDVMACYRVHAAGFWSGWTSFDRWQQTLQLFDSLEAHFQGRYQQEIRLSRENLLAILRKRVADLERIERRYFALKLDRFAAIAKWFRELFVRPRRTP